MTSPLKVPVNEPVLTKEAKQYVAEAMESGWISSAGKYIEQFEAEFAAFLGVKHAVTTTSGTTAIHLALATLNIGPGDEVIVPDFTMMGSILPVLYCGATPIFVDAKPETFNIDPSLIEKKITKKTKAIMPVHLYGQSADMDPILAIAKKHNLYVVEDAAEAHGATYKGCLCGSMGDIGCFSFYANKIITTGEGGMLVTNDDQLVARARTLKDLAHSPQKRFWHEEMGFNYRMTNLQAAVGLGQLKHIDEFIKHKQWMADRYREGLKGIKGLRLPAVKKDSLNVYWMYGVLVEESFPMAKDELRAALREKGVDTRDFFYSSASQPLFKDLPSAKESFPVSKMLSERGFYLPSGLALTEEQVDYVCSALREIASI
ncbi:hypothetical protein A3D88_01505 [Candidatus Peribacteria bacterium RIFCSPHIGHO2_02_FULL_52_16]|nr:MAG: hypothetical protein A2706_03745 [Candidatus Peribacteria bacterium RIFCSPHIGHO2_01_FULL_51_35]OGJ60996.1 MAG: hypothetical protein A3D88_01505 [Candidatus Peribacteria bacterium RIFCSPHIGHO2_02_FULL_52_16]